MLPIFSQTTSTGSEGKKFFCLALGSLGFFVVYCDYPIYYYFFFFFRISCIPNYNASGNFDGREKARIHKRYCEIEEQVGEYKIFFPFFISLRKFTARFCGNIIIFPFFLVRNLCTVVDFEFFFFFFVALVQIFFS